MQQPKHGAGRAAGWDQLRSTNTGAFHITLDLHHQQCLVRCTERAVWMWCGMLRATPTTLKASGLDSSGSQLMRSEG